MKEKEKQQLTSAAAIIWAAAKNKNNIEPINNKKQSTHATNRYNTGPRWQRKQKFNNQTLH